jgi:hypothetical protein
MRRTRPTTGAIVACLAALVTTACGPHADLHLNMRQVSLTVPRVLTPAVTLVPPAPITVPLPVPAIPSVPPSIPTFVPPPPKLPACPKASEFAVPAEPASVDVSSGPTPAMYVQTSRGSYSGSAAKPSSGKLIAPVVTSVTNLPRTTAAQTGQVSDNWLVSRVDTVTHDTTYEAYQLATPTGSGQLVTPGIYLTGMKWKDPVRGELSFVPTGSGIEIMPSPVNASSTATFASSATDPNSLTTMTATGNVLGKKRIDVCGTLVDTWTVQLAGALTSPNFKYQFAWRQQIATQYGGVDVEDQLTLATPGTGLTWDRTLHDTNTPEVKK